MPSAFFSSVLRKVRPNRLSIDWASLAAAIKSLATQDLTFKGPAGALIILAAFFTLGIGVLLMQANELGAMKLERDAKTDQLAVLRKKQPPQLQGTGTDQAVDIREPFIVATTKTLAAAEVDRLLRAAVADSAGNLLSSRVEGASEDFLQTATPGQDHRIAADVVIEGKIEALQALVFQLETGAPYFFIESLNVQPAQIGGESSNTPMLRATFKTVAYWRVPA